MNKSEKAAIEDSVMVWIKAMALKAIPESNYPDYVERYGEPMNIGIWFPRTAFDKSTSASLHLAYGRFEGWKIKIKYTKGSKWYEGNPPESRIELSHINVGTIVCTARRGKFVGRTPRTMQAKFKPDHFGLTDESKITATPAVIDKELKHLAMMMKLQV
ncbi:hypothetical protein QM996_02430 [Sinorhizobium chiapasense]